MGAWIETYLQALITNKGQVAPHVGAWIETSGETPPESIITSLPTWERGLKRITPITQLQQAQVAPHAGAWIETTKLSMSYAPLSVAPHAGAWIETSTYSHLSMAVRSLPMRERGLKLA